MLDTPYIVDRQILDIWFVVRKNVIGKCNDWLHFRLSSRCSWILLSSGMWRKNYWATGARRFDTEQSYHTQRWNVKKKSPFLDVKLHTSEETTPLTIISLMDVLINVVGC